MSSARVPAGICAAAVSLLLMCPYPEVFLTLFVFAGVFKAHPALALPYGLDWSAVMGAFAVWLVALRFILAERRRRLRFRPADVFLVGLILILCLGLLLSNDRAYGIERVGELVSLGVLASFYMIRIISSLASWEKMVQHILVAIFSLASVTAVLSLLGWAVRNRAFASSYLVWSSFLGVSILAGLGLLSISSSKPIRMLIVGLEALMAVEIILAKSRGVAIALVGTLAVVIVGRGMLSRREKSKLILLAVAFLLTMLLILPRATWSRYTLLFAEERGGSIEARIDAYELAWNIFSRHPLLGAGTGSFRDFAEKRDSPYHLDYAHNALLEVAAENGLAGLCCYIGFIVAVLVAYRRIRRTYSIDDGISKLASACMSIFVFLLIASQFSGAIIGRNELFFAGILVAMGPATYDSHVRNHRMDLAHIDTLM